MAPVDVRRKGLDIRSEDIVGQAGTIVPVNESRFTVDEHILDPDNPLAVQIPEGVGADTSRHTLGMVEAFRAGTAEAQFAAAENNEEVDADFSVGVETPPVYNKSELERTADPVADVADASPGAELRDTKAEDADEAIDPNDVEPSDEHVASREELADDDK